MPTANVLPDKVIWFEEESWLNMPLQAEGSSYLDVDNGTYLGSHTPEDSSYLYTSTDARITAIGFGITPGDAVTITAVSVNIRGKIEDNDGLAYIELYLCYGTEEAFEVTGNPKTVNAVADFGGFNMIGECTKIWTGLTLAKADADTLYVRLVYHTG